MALDPNIIPQTGGRFDANKVKPTPKQQYESECFNGEVPAFELQPDELEVLNKKHSGTYLIELYSIRANHIRTEIESALSIYQWAYVESELEILRNLVSRIGDELGWLRFSSQIVKQLKQSRIKVIKTNEFES